MGTVYAAAHPRLPRRIALKVLHPALAEDDDARARFEREADHAARLEHPNIVAVYDRGREGDRLWIAMQYVEGTDAATAGEGGPLDSAANILVEHPRPGHRGDPGRVLLADFGIAKALEQTQHVTKTWMLVATLQYAAPEQFANLPLDARADVYSLGCTLFRLLTGQQPYPGSPLAPLMAGHLNSPIPRPAALRAGLPAGFDEVIARALAKDREERYPSCGALAAAAQHALGPAEAVIPTRWRPTSRRCGRNRRRTARHPHPSSPNRPPGPPPRPRHGRRKKPSAHPMPHRPNWPGPPTPPSTGSGTRPRKSAGGAGRPLW
ncbi:serine/threonine-protein kinase [Rhodococcus opacus]|uniref:serine/threonine-protein kinase n=1 Tax=Rhodococcus opacus TaxID=37919 RepID=UPI0002A3CBA3|nr:serine/threonine-protein kinase [Rhodococcus opacus]ELB92602.1 serine/threonine protein kinase [Rhodococcus wratislaviensis IFP 2016]MDX5966359.1 serine/threonine-protein kinase [Rhodococcus opacus]CAG7581940.1 Serine/threonine-protein kinase PknD [Rhodococcus opacus]